MNSATVIITVGYLVGAVVTITAAHTIVSADPEMEATTIAEWIAYTVCTILAVLLWPIVLGQIIGGIHCSLPTRKAPQETEPQDEPPDEPYIPF